MLAAVVLARAQDQARGQGLVVQAGSVGPSHRDEPSDRRGPLWWDTGVLHLAGNQFLIEPRRRALIYAVGHEPTEPGFPLQRLTQEALRTEVLKTMADNRLDALLYATYDHAPTKLPHTTLGNNRQLAPVLGFPALAVPGGFSSDGLPLGFEFLGIPSPKELCSKRRMTSNSPQKFAGLRPLHRHC
jgi:hypothetical protein